MRARAALAGFTCVVIDEYFDLCRPGIQRFAVRDQVQDLGLLHRRTLADDLINLILGHFQACSISVLTDKAVRERAATVVIFFKPRRWARFRRSRRHQLTPVSVKNGTPPSGSSSIPKKTLSFFGRMHQEASHRTRAKCIHATVPQGGGLLDGEARSPCKKGVFLALTKDFLWNTLSRLYAKDIDNFFSPP